jgi:DNA polymerase III epsilon subunit-like protein
MYLFFDTETTGLPRNYNAPVTDSVNWPRMVQIAWQVYNSDGTFIESNDFIIKPEAYKIPFDAAKVHGISTERAMAEGNDLTEVLHKFNSALEDALVLVAHNISFDEKIIGAEFHRKSIKNQLNRKQKICTMKSSVDFCKIPGNYGYKWPKLAELHKVLFGTNFEEAHNAAADINATVKCFWNLREKGVI